MKVKHNLDPIYDTNSEILILGSMPSEKSREQGFYYAHPQNRFWPTLERVFNEKIDDKKRFLLDKHIALWDILKVCDINKSSDSSIKKEKPNNIKKIIKESNIKVIFTTGKTAYKYYQKYFKDKIHLDVICLNSTSPANCQIKDVELIEEYKIIKKYLDYY